MVKDLKINALAAIILGGLLKDSIGKTLLAFEGISEKELDNFQEITDQIDADDLGLGINGKKR